MTSENYIATPKRLVALLERHGFKLKKNFGQNFLIDVNILQKIVRVADVQPQTIVLEIGCGVGSLTQVLARVAKMVQCFEIDYQLQPLLAETVGDCPNVQLSFTDFLKVDLVSWYASLNIAASEDVKVVANLPYYITTPILEKIIIWFVTEKPQLTSATLMMQKEVAQRLIAQPKTKEYGSLAIFVQLFSNPHLAFDVSKKVFIPEPRVDSAIVHLKFKQTPYFATYAEAEAFLGFVRKCFATRRKTLYNNLKDEFTREEVVHALHQAKVAENARAEVLSIEEFLVVFKTLYRISNKEG